MPELVFKRLYGLLAKNPLGDRPFGISPVLPSPWDVVVPVFCLKALCSYWPDGTGWDSQLMPVDSGSEVFKEIRAGSGHAGTVGYVPQAF